MIRLRTRHPTIMLPNYGRLGTDYIFSSIGSRRQRPEPPAWCEKSAILDRLDGGACIDGLLSERHYRTSCVTWFCLVRSGLEVTHNAHDSDLARPDRCPGQDPEGPRHPAEDPPRVDRRWG